MDRSTTSAPDGAAAMRTTERAALDFLLPAAAGEPREPASAAKALRAVLGLPVLRQPSDGRHVGGRPHTHSAVHARVGDRGPLSQTESEPPGAGARDLPVLAARRLDRAAQPSLEHRYYVPSDAWRLPLPGGGHGLVQPLRTQLGTLQYHGDRFLPGRAGSGVPLRPTRNLELRSGFAVHRSRFSGSAQAAGCVHQHGWARPRSRQRVHRAAVAQFEIRTRLSRRLRQRRRSVPCIGTLLPFLQSPASAPGAGLPHAGRSVPTPGHKEKIIAIMGGFAPHAPQDLSLFSSRVDRFPPLVTSDCRTMDGLDRRIGQRRDATRAPNQARSGWRPSGRLLDSPLHHLRNPEILSKQPGPPHLAASARRSAASSFARLTPLGTYFRTRARARRNPCSRVSRMSAPSSVTTASSSADG